MSQLRPLALALAVPVLLASACDGTTPTEADVPPGPDLSLGGVHEQVAQGYTDFGFQAFRSLAQEEPEENIFFSGTSLAFALAMPYHGADGETRGEMARMLGVEGLDLEEFNSSNQAWLDALLEGTGETELSIANSVWARAGFPFEVDFLERNETYYRAVVESVDFDDPATVDRINRWVSDETNGRIEEIVEEIDPLDIMFLINAIHFLGEWTTPFPEESTSPRPFTVPDGSREDVPTMTLRDTLHYHHSEEEGYEAVRLPYGEDERFAMYVFLPERESDLQAFYRDLDAAEWERRLGALSPTDVELRLPRFTLEYEKELIATLKGLGMERAFDSEAADFTPMTQARDDVHISQVLQKSFVQVNETGTEAAAVTSVTVSVTSAPAHPIMSVDRPFFFAIRDDETGTVLFQGQVIQPEDPNWDGTVEGG